MHGWASVDTARCAGCAIFTVTAELRQGPDGRPYCAGCPVPHRAASAPAPTNRRAAESWDWETVLQARASARMEACRRWVVLSMLLVTLAFPLAACVSQL